ncbi:MAG: LamG domain-containing protein [Phycisphaerales bacterium]|nr:MAG: LamG domain-containing protein [Phycisphaerales bacterium]
MNNENIEEILKNIGAEQVPADIQKLAQETSNNFSKSLMQEQPKPGRPVLLEYIMNSRLPKLAAAAMIVIAVLIGLNYIGDNSVAWATLVEHVEQIKTVAYQMDMKMKGMMGMDKDKSVDIDMEAKLAYDEGFVINSTTHADGESMKAKTYVLFAEDAIVSVIPQKKAYLKMKLTGELLEKFKKDNGDPRTMLKETMEYEYTELGRDTIDGIRVEGIEVTDPAIGEGMFDTVVAQLWCDVKNDLPVLMTMKGSASNGAVALDITLSGFNWDAEIDPAELVPDIPEDYKLLAEAEAGGGKDGNELVEGLEFYAEMADGTYPSSLTGLTVVSEFAQAARAKFAGQQPTEKRMKEVMSNMVKLEMAAIAYGAMAQDGNDPAYYGDKVTAEFPHAVLVRWKMGDNAYRVIFGDLSIKDVTAEKLAELEALPLNLDPKPIKPDPADGTEGMALKGTKLKWMAGAYAVEHKVHFGTSPDDLSLLGTTKGTEFDELPALEREATYYWRVDAVSSDGNVAEGDVWTLGTGLLVAWYRFDEGSGDTVVDSGPTGIDGTAHGDPSWAEGALDKALVLDGNDAYVNLGNHPKFNITNQITVSAWIKVNAFDRNYQTIISKGDTSWRLQRNAGTDTLEFGCMGLPLPNNPVWGGIFGKISVNDGQWHHAAGTYDGEKISLYVDGALDVSVDVIGTIRSNDYEVYIGANAEKPGRFWNGLVDDVRVYNYALIADEIAGMFSSR